MLEPSLPLGSFVCPIPICQPEADLGSILKIFQNFKCRTIAIPLNNGCWGVVNSENLLSLMTRVLSSKQMVLVGHPKNRSYQSEINRITIQDLDYPIEPAVVYQGSTELREFIGTLSEDSGFGDRIEYLVVDRMGKLQGKLDRNKILKYLATSSQKIATRDSETSSILTSWCNSIDAIALPLAIESATGQILHANQSWQKSEFDDIEPKSSADEPTENNSSKIAADLSLDILAISPSGTSITPPDHSLANRDVPHEERSPNLIDRTDPELQIERVGNWNLLKLPLAAPQAKTAPLSLCWIVLATKLPYQQLHQTVSPTINEETLGNLLASLSHELKSPLTGISGLSNLLKAEKIGKLNHRQARYVNLIQHGNRNAIAIVEDLSKLTNLVKQQLPLETVELEPLCRQLYQQVLTEIQSSQSEEPNSVVGTKLNLSVEPESKIVTVNRAVLSAILYHLMIEISKTVDSLPSQLKISNLQGSTAIEIGGNARDFNFSLPPESANFISPNSGFNLAIAHYLAQIIAGRIDIIYAKDYCQFTLRLPQGIVRQKPNRGKRVEVHRPKTVAKSLTILCLYPELEAVDLQLPHQNDTFNLRSWSSGGDRQLEERHRIIEADSLEQAHTLARIWQLDVIILDGYRIADPIAYLRSLLKSKYLSALPLITLDARTTEAANQFEGLNVYPCLLPAEQRSFTELMQVIQIAIEA